MIGKGALICHRMSWHKCPAVIYLRVFSFSFSWKISPKKWIKIKKKKKRKKKQTAQEHTGQKPCWNKTTVNRFLTTLTGSFLSWTGPPILAGSLLSRTGLDWCVGNEKNWNRGILLCDSGSVLKTTVIAEIFVRVKISYSSVCRLSYAGNFRTATVVSDTHAYVYGFRMLLNFVLSVKSTKYTKLNRVRKFVRVQYFRLTFQQIRILLFCVRQIHTRKNNDLVSNPW